LVLQTLLYTTGKVLEGSKGADISTARRECFEKIAEVAGLEFVPCDLENRLHLVEHKHGNFVLALLMKKDKQIVAEEKGGCTLSETFAEKLTKEQLASWTACNKGAFVLLHMYESGSTAAQQAVKEVVAREGKKLKQSSFAGAEVLLKKVKV